MKNILIIGCGLLGSSLLRRISKKKIAKKIFIYEKSKLNISKIKKLKLSGTIVKSLKEGVTNSDLIIFCTPMSEYKDIILKINNFISSKTLITDIGSSKIETSKIIKKFLKKGVHWTQSHPIAGSEVSGPEHGKENMFTDRWCIIIKEKNTKKNNIKILTKFWKKIGSKVVVMNPKKHDKIFSITSHLPHLIAYNLVKSAQDFEKKQSYELIKYSAGGLRDFSRIAASNEIMWRDIFFNNKDNIINSINIFTKNLNNFKRLIKNENNKSVLKILRNSKKVRRQIIELKQDVSKPNFGRDIF